ncbi:MAG: hypothetical protein M1483_07950 [Actinobacteria bacterium]|nr:hypothetical protein [Actinomycetota bacterium]MCL6105542.1 hypothetical protein [Actinomycetota bacterium]
MLTARVNIDDNIVTYLYNLAKREKRVMNLKGGRTVHHPLSNANLIGRLPEHFNDCLLALEDHQKISS